MPTARELPTMNVLDLAHETECLPNVTLATVGHFEGPFPLLCMIVGIS